MATAREKMARRRAQEKSAGIAWPRAVYFYPWEVFVRMISGERRAFLKATGEEVIIGPPEKMSKSKKNIVTFGSK